MSRGQQLGTRPLRKPAIAIAMLTVLLIGGCTPSPTLLMPLTRKTIDRKVIEYPKNCVLKIAADSLTAPSAIAFVNDAGEYKGSLLVAESGVNDEPRIYGWKPDGTYFSVYPHSPQLLPTFGLLPRPKDFYGPVGGMVVVQGHIFVTHRDHRGRGVVSAFGFDGSCTTIVPDLPAEGDFGVTDIVYEVSTNRLVFGVGAATNSGVVGIDNVWVKANPDFCDLPAVKLKLTGGKFLTNNPDAGLFGQDNVETGPFQPFGTNNKLNIAKATNSKPTAAIYSVSPMGGDLKVVAWGIRNPRGLAFEEQHGRLFATNNGMELRGSRPVKGDIDSLIQISPETWYGWPDYSTDFIPITNPTFTDPRFVSRSGYEELTALINPKDSLLVSPEGNRDILLAGQFPALSGAAKFDFVPLNSVFRDYAGHAIVALSGDRAPYATSGEKLVGPVGFRVVRIDLDKKMQEFIRNTEGAPASMLSTRSPDAMERPIDIKFGPDGNLYILDYGRMEMRNGRERISAGTGRIYVLQPG